MLARRVPDAYFEADHVMACKRREMTWRDWQTSHQIIFGHLPENILPLFFGKMPMQDNSYAASEIYRG
jgi:hypothetical protein